MNTKKNSKNQQTKPTPVSFSLSLSPSHMGVVGFAIEKFINQKNKKKGLLWILPVPRIRKLRSSCCYPKAAKMNSHGKSVQRWVKFALIRRAQMIALKKKLSNFCCRGRGGAPRRGEGINLMYYNI